MLIGLGRGVPAWKRGRKWEWAVWVFIAGGPEPWKYGLTYAVSGFIASTEFKSILENVASITGINLWDKIKDRLNGWLGNDKPNEQNGG